MKATTKTTQTPHHTKTRPIKKQTTPFAPAERAEGDLQHIAVNDISLSPLNYRTSYSQTALEELATEMQQHGVISPITVRPLNTGTYELVAGERRLRAARIAGLVIIPATIRELTDEQVTEIQLAENIQRENPHPMQEAVGIGRLQQSGHRIEEISHRIGKSKSYVYSRLLLLSLIADFQEMLAADRLTLSDALKIAQLTPESQTAFYAGQQAEDWKDKPDYRLHNVDYALRHFSNDLQKAPFDTKDKSLLPNVGACTKCPSNTATLKSLFPDMANEAICKNLSCYQQKCTAHFSLHLAAALLEHQPQALLTSGALPATQTAAIAAHPQAAALPILNYYNTPTLDRPEAPDKEEYGRDDDAENESDEAEWEEESYAEACQEYQQELEEYETEIASGNWQKGILIGNGNLDLIYYNPDTEEQKDSPLHKPATAKAVAEALKSGTATPELLEGEINRIQEREKRSKEIDRQKVQDQVHAAFDEHIAQQGSAALTTADEVAARLLIFQQLGYFGERLFFSSVMGEEAERPEGTALYDWLANLNSATYSQMIRTALARKPESKQAHNTTGYTLYQVADQAGVAVADIEQQQAEKAQKREERQEEKIAALQAKRTKLTATA